MSFIIRLKGKGGRRRAIPDSCPRRPHVMPMLAGARQRLQARHQIVFVAHERAQALRCKAAGYRHAHLNVRVAQVIVQFISRQTGSPPHAEPPRPHRAAVHATPQAAHSVRQLRAFPEAIPQVIAMNCGWRRRNRSIRSSLCAVTQTSPGTRWASFSNARCGQAGQSASATSQRRRPRDDVPVRSGPSMVTPQYSCGRDEQPPCQNGDVAAMPVTARREWVIV